MKISLILCTSDRPEAFALTEKYIKRQTLQPTEVVILDDGNVPVRPTLGRHIYCPECRGGNSMINKLKIAFTPGFISGDIAICWEDDDAYAPNWIETCAKALGDGRIDMFGEGRAIYYNVRDRWWFEHANMTHASLCSTAFTKRLFPLALRLCEDSNPFLDDRLWKHAPGNRKRIVDPQSYGPKGPRRLVLGIKAMPGKVGYGGGHAREDRNAKKDPDGAKLRELIGEDAALYEEFWSGYVPPVNLRVPAHTDTAKRHGSEWMKYLGDIAGQPNISGLEIGTFRGDSAEFMCENVFFHETARYYCVDPFTGNPEHAAAGIDCTTLESDSRLRLSVFPQARIIKEYSHHALRRFNLELSWAYVDGAHDAMNCLRDSVMAFDALKVGGVLCWDDVTWGSDEMPATAKPKIAVEAFLNCYQPQIEVLLHGGWQTIIRKTKE